MHFHLLDKTVDFLIKINNIPIDHTDNYNSKIEKLKKDQILQNIDTFSNDLTRDITQSKIQTFFKSGQYGILGAGVPSCTYINGPIYIGSCNIYDQFECNNPEQDFVQKNIFVTSVDNNIFGSILSTYFNKNLNSINGSPNSSLKGQYDIYNNRLHNFYEGYLYDLGRNIKGANIYKLTPGGFTLTNYFLDDNHNYQVQSIQQFIKQTDAVIL